MPSTPESKKERCAICSGELRHTTITHEERRGENIYLFRNVPAQVCAACEEVWIEEATLQEIERLIQQGRPTSKVETPIYDFAILTLS